MRSFCVVACGCLIALTGGGTLIAEDSGGYRGPNRCGIHPGGGLIKSWPEGGPELLWRYPRKDEDAWEEEIALGAGWCNVSVTDGTVYTSGMRYDDGAKNTYAFAFDLDGKVKWITKLCKGLGCGRFEGPRATPECVDGKVYLTSGKGEVFCLDAADGEILWQVDTRREGIGNKIAGWGYNLSPLIADGKVILPIRRGTCAMVALDAETGEVAWKSPLWKDCAVVDSSPVLVEVGDRKLALCNMFREMFAVDVADGSLAWKKSGKMRTMMTPIVSGGYVFADYAQKLTQLKPVLREGKVDFEVVRDFGRMVDLDQAVVMDGRIYRFGRMPVEKPGKSVEGGKPRKKRRRRGKPAVVCIDVETGKTLAHLPCEMTPRSIIAADGMVYVIESANTAPGNGKGLYREKGRLTLIRPTEDGMEYAGAFQPAVGTKEIYVAPVISNGRLFHRHGTTLAVYDLRTSE